MALGPHIIALLASSAVLVAGCAQPAALPQVGAAPSATEGPLALASPRPKPRHADACKLTRVSLPDDRKAELFRQFAAEQAGVDDAVAVPPAPSNCRQAAR